MPSPDEPNPATTGRAAAPQHAGAGDAPACIDPTLRPFDIDAQNLRAAVRRGERLVLGAAAALALLMHVAVLYALTRQQDGPAGAGGVELDAISVEVTLVPASALESRAETAAPASGTAGNLSPTEGLSEPVPAQSREKAETQEKEQTPALQQETAARIAEPQKEAPEKHNEQRDKTAPDQPPPAEAGGTTARADALVRQPIQAAAVASPGVVRDYASRVASALGKSRPKGSGVRGTVRISFAVRPDGTLDFVRVATPSGSERLDEAAVAAIRHARFPPPPAGMSALQRTFVLPYQFR